MEINASDVQSLGVEQKYDIFIVVRERSPVDGGYMRHVSQNVVLLAGAWLTMVLLQAGTDAAKARLDSNLHGGPVDPGGAPRPIHLLTAVNNVPPTLVSVPNDLIIGPGRASRSLDIKATGSSPLSYQWRKNEVLIPNATNASYTWPSPLMNPADSGLYSVVVSNPFGTTTSSNIVVTVTASPVIFSQPTNARAVLMTTTTFRVEAAGSPRLIYQWQKDGIDLAGETGTNLVISNVSLSDQANYRVKVRNLFGTATSSDAALVVTSTNEVLHVAPTPLGSPVSHYLAVGTNVTLSTSVLATKPLLYEWLKDGVPIPGATNATLALTNLQTSASGRYANQVSNPLGTVRSHETTLTIGVPPTILSRPVNTVAYLGSAAGFFVTAAGTDPITYQWRLNGRALPHATNTVFEIGAVQTNDLASYDVTVTNPFGSITSPIATLALPAPPLITSQPRSQIAPTGAQATFALSASGSSSLDYQWYKDGAPLITATNTSLTISNVQQPSIGAYWAVITNGFGSVTSSVVSLTLGVPPSLVTHPISQTVALGATVLLSTSATGHEPLFYQWSKDGTNILMATESVLPLTNFTGLKSGTYAVKVSNAFGSIISSNATLIVDFEPPLIVVQPRSSTGYLGQPATLSASILGTPSPSFQWFKNGTAIVGASGLTLSIGSLTIDDAGSYSVSATNTFGSITSSNAALTVLDTPPIITVRPRIITVSETYPFTLRASAIGQVGAYTWFKDERMLAGVTNATYQVTNATLADAGTYRVSVTNAVGVVTSTNTVVSVEPAYLWTTLAGLRGVSGNRDGKGPDARFGSPSAILASNSGDILVTDFDYGVVRIVSRDGTVTTLRDASGLPHRFVSPTDIAQDTQGNIYVMDLGISAVIVIDTKGVRNSLSVGSSWGIGVDPVGNIFVSGNLQKYGVDGGITQLASAGFFTITDITQDSQGSFLFADVNRGIMKIAVDGTVTTLAGNSSRTPTDGQGTAAGFRHANSVALDSNGNLFVADEFASRIVKVSPTGMATTVGGLVTGVIGGTAGADGIGSAARFQDPQRVAVDSSGVLYVPDRGNRTIRKGVPLNRTVAVPTLEIATTDTEVVLSWPATAIGFALESSDTLSPTPPWVAVPSTVNTNGPRLTVRQPFTDGARYFRLRMP